MRRYAYPDRRRRRGNPPLPKAALGRKVQDGYCGAWTYEAYLITDDYGVRCDPRFGTPCRDYTKEN